MPTTYKTFRNPAPVAQGTGLLPSIPQTDSSLATWEFLTGSLLSIESNSQVRDAVDGLYNAYLSGGDPTPFQNELGSLFSGFSESIIGLPQSPYSVINIYLQNSEGVIRASNVDALVGATNNGRTEIVVAQTDDSVIPCVWRVSSTDGLNSYYVAKGSYFGESSANPLYILRIKAVLKSS